MFVVSYLKPFSSFMFAIVCQYLRLYYISHSWCSP